VLFLKVSDVILTNGASRDTIDIDTSTCEAITSTINGDLLTVENQKGEFTYISELRQIEILLKILETTLGNFYKVPPKLDRRLGLIDFDGTIWMVPF